MPKTLAETIRAERRKRGLTQQKLADMMSDLRGRKDADFSFQQVARLEAGRVLVRPEHDEDEPLWPALKVLGIQPAVAKQFLGWL